MESQLKQIKFLQKKNIINIKNITNILCLVWRFHDAQIICNSLWGTAPASQNRNIWPTTSQENKQGRNVSHQPPVCSAWEPGTVFTATFPHIDWSLSPSRNKVFILFRFYYSILELKLYMNFLVHEAPISYHITLMLHFPRKILIISVEITQKWVSSILSKPM